MLSRISSSLKPHHDPSFKVEFDQQSIRSAGSVVEGVINLILDDSGGAGGTGRKAFSELRISFGVVQVSLGSLHSLLRIGGVPEEVRREGGREAEPSSRALTSFLHRSVLLPASHPPIS